MSTALQQQQKNFTDLLTIFSASFPFLKNYKLGVILTLLGRTYKINNTLLGLDEKVEKLFCTIKKNQFPEGLIKKALNRYLDKISTSTALPVDSKLPMVFAPFIFSYHIFSNFTIRELHALVKRY